MQNGQAPLHFDDVRVSLGSAALPTMTSVGPVRGLEVPGARGSFESRASIDNEFLDVGRSVSGWWNFGGLGAGGSFGVGMRRLSAMVGMGTGAATVVSSGSGLQSVTKGSAVEAGLRREEELRMQRYMYQQSIGVSGNELQVAGNAMPPLAIQAVNVYSGDASDQAALGKIYSQDEEERRCLRRRYHALVLVVVALVVGSSIMIWRLTAANRELNGQVDKLGKLGGANATLPPPALPATNDTGVVGPPTPPTPTPTTPPRPARPLTGTIEIAFVRQVEVPFLKVAPVDDYIRGDVTFDVVLSDSVIGVSGLLFENGNAATGRLAGKVIQARADSTNTSLALVVANDEPTTTSATRQSEADAPGRRWISYARFCTGDFTLQLTFRQAGNWTTVFEKPAICGLG
jgi:hypothetical protein